MKKHMITLLIALSLMAPVCSAQSANEADISAVKKVIANETDALFAKTASSGPTTGSMNPTLVGRHREVGIKC